MAYSPPLDTRPPVRSFAERRWLIVIAALAMFAYYVASGSYEFVPFNAPTSAPSAVAETSSLRSEKIAPVQAVDVEIEAVIPSGEPTLTAETSSASVAVVTEPQPAPVAEIAPAVVQNTVPAVAQNAAPAVSAPQPPVSAPAVAASGSVVERWQAQGIVIVTQGQEWDEQSLANVDAALSALPASVRSQLGNPALGQMHILVNSHGRALSGKQPYGGPANFFATGDGVNELVMFPRQRVSTILHELGHAYNLRRIPAGNYAKVLLDAEMQSFLAATGWEVLTPRDQVAAAVDHMKLSYAYHGSFMWPGLSHNDPLEDFANSFATYFYDPSGLKAQSPERYDWMAANLPK
jgi:hypothetical protein